MTMHPPHTRPPLELDQRIRNACSKPATALAAVRALSEGEYDARFGPPPVSTARQTQKASAMEAEAKEEKRLLDQRAKTDPMRVEHTNDAAYTRSGANAFGLVAFFAILLIDPIIMVFVSATYVANAAVFATLANNMPMSVLFSLFVLMGMFGWKALATYLPNDRARHVYARGVIVVGLAIGVVGIGTFAVLFNPLTLQAANETTVGAATLAVTGPTSTLPPIILVAAKILGGSLLGAGIWMTWEQRANANKVQFVEVKADYRLVSDQITAQREQITQIATEIDTLDAEARKYAANRAVFVESCVALCERYLAQADAAAAKARLDALTDPAIPGFGLATPVPSPVAESSPATH